MKYLSYILQVWYAEMMQVFHNFGLLLFCIIVPLAYPLLYAFVYTNETVREVPVAVVDECHSSLSREFARKVDACTEVTVKYHTDLAQAQELMRREEVYSIMRIPASFDKDLARGNQTYIGLYADMRCMLYYKAALLAATNVSLDMNADIKVNNYLRPTTDRQSEIMKAPVTNSYVPLFNPQSGIASFLIPAVLMLIIQQLLFLSIGTSMGIMREENRGIGVQLRNPDYRNPFCIVVGKVLFYLPVFLLVAVYMYAGVTDWFQLLALGDYVTFLLFIVPYILACILLGITMSAFIFRSEDSMLLYIFMSVPLLFLSGMSWPVAAEPKFWQYVSWLFPSTFGMHGYVKIMGTGATLSEVAWEFRNLWIQCGVYLLTACYVYRRELKKMLRISE